MSAVNLSVEGFKDIFWWRNLPVVAPLNKNLKEEDIPLWEGVVFVLP